MQVYFDSDVDLNLIKDKTIAIIGYGSQGKAHAANLRDSGVSRVIVALREGSPSQSLAKAEGFEILTPGEAARIADIVMLLAPDEQHPSIYKESLAQSMKTGATLMFAHGLNIHFDLIKAREDLDVVLVAPKGPGHALRQLYLVGQGLPCLFAVDRDNSGKAQELCLAYAAAIGGGRSGIMETNFREECETDLFGEQAVLCGGIPDIIKAGYDTLVEAGYEPEMAYFECVHEVKLIVDLIYERGIANMRNAISNTAEFGGYVTGARVVTDDTKKAMKQVLDDIQKGDFARKFMTDHDAGGPEMKAYREVERQHGSEESGSRLRAMMPWMKQS